MLSLKLAEPRTYSEINQSSTSRFSLLRQVGEFEYEELFYPVRCRDFLGDAVFATSTGSKAHIYQFSFDPWEKFMQKDQLLLSVHFSNRDEYKRVVKNLDTLWKIETVNGLDCTGFFEYNNNVLILSADPFWQSNMWAISLYTHIIRCIGCKESIDKLFGDVGRFCRESEYMQRIGKHNWEKLTTNLQKIAAATTDPSGYGDTAFNEKIHNCCGIATLFSTNPIQKNLYREAFDAL